MANGDTCLLVLIFLTCAVTLYLMRSNNSQSVSDGTVIVSHDNQSIFLLTADVLDMVYVSALFGISLSDIIGLQHIKNNLIIKPTNNNLYALIDGSKINLITKRSDDNVKRHDAMNCYYSVTANDTKIAYFNYGSATDADVIKQFDNWKLTNPNVIIHQMMAYPVCYGSSSTGTSLFVVYSDN